MITRSAFARSLSVLMQGPLTRDNGPAIAARCRHWRALLPESPLLLSISRRRETSAALHRLAASFGLDTLCSRIVVAPAARPLPPIKRGLGDNHVNLQIAAARAGLAMVDTEHVLRIRGDLAFADSAFVDLYLNHRDHPRSAAAVLRDRVMIAPWFTLDPLTLERLPFHFSDWFHLGRTDDVRALWRVDEMTAEDATWYRRHRVADANAREAGFLSRLAAEQHLVTAAYAGLGRALPLAFHNDPAGAGESLRLLADDFVVADFDAAPVLLDKYRHLREARDIDLVCVTHEDWRALVNQPATDPHLVFAARIGAARRMLARDAPRHAWWRRLNRR